MIKSIVGMVAGIGVTQLVNNVVTVTTPTNLTKAKKIATVIGGMALSSVLSKTVTNYTDYQIDSLKKVFDKTNKDHEEVL